MGGTFSIIPVKSKQPKRFYDMVEVTVNCDASLLLVLI